MRLSQQFHLWRHCRESRIGLLCSSDIAIDTSLLRMKYETHLIKPLNLSIPCGKAWVADAIIANLIVERHLELSLSLETGSLSDNMQSADRSAYQ